jgi:hypothetical protein
METFHTTIVGRSVRRGQEVHNAMLRAPISDGVRKKLAVVRYDGL